MARMADAKVKGVLVDDRAIVARALSGSFAG
jgi:predicted DNA repair protein MutK